MFCFCILAADALCCSAEACGVLCWHLNALSIDLARAHQTSAFAHMRPLSHCWPLYSVLLITRSPVRNRFGPDYGEDRVIQDRDIQSTLYAEVHGPQTYTIGMKGLYLFITFECAISLMDPLVRAEVTEYKYLFIMWPLKMLNFKVLRRLCHPFSDPADTTMIMPAVLGFVRFFSFDIVNDIIQAMQSGARLAVLEAYSSARCMRHRATAPCHLFCGEPENIVFALPTQHENV
jgi:hypothetical protein